jgi:hypothetical protein
MKLLCVASAAHISTTQVNRNPTIGAYASSANIESKPMKTNKNIDMGDIDIGTIKAAALAALNKAANQIYRIEGDQWQEAYETIEAVIDNLTTNP